MKNKSINLKPNKMIPEEKIEQAASLYRDELLKEKKRTTGQFVGVPLTCNQIESQVVGYVGGYSDGVRFAEAEMKQYAQQQAQEFAEWIAKHGFIFTRHGWWNGPMFIYNTTPELYAMFIKEQKGAENEIQN